MEPASELRAIEVRRVSDVTRNRESMQDMLIRVVPPKPFGPFCRDGRSFFMCFSNNTWNLPDFPGV